MIRSFFLLLCCAAAPALWGQAHETCVTCHTQQTGDFKKHRHFEMKLSCDACHGASKQHTESQGMVAPEKVSGPLDQPALCGACHTAQSKDYLAGVHGKLVMERSAKRGPYCTMCHGNHALRPFDAAAQCARCHAELPAACKQTPPPAAAAKPARVSCANCHDRHTLVVKK